MSYFLFSNEQSEAKAGHHFSNYSLYRLRVISDGSLEVTKDFKTLPSQ